MCLTSEELILPEETIMPKNLMPQKHKMWDLRSAALVKNEETLKKNLWSLYTVVMSFCNATMEHKVMRHEEYAEIKHTTGRNMIELLQVINVL